MVSELSGEAAAGARQACRGVLALPLAWNGAEHKGVEADEEEQSQ